MNLKSNRMENAEKRNDLIFAFLTTYPVHVGKRFLKMEIPESNKYVTSVRNINVGVVVVPATVELLQSELESLGVIVSNLATVEVIATAFASDLISKKDGKLALCRVGKVSKFYEIIEYRCSEQKIKDLGLL